MLSNQNHLISGVFVRLVSRLSYLSRVSPATVRKSAILAHRAAIVRTQCSGTARSPPLDCCTAGTAAADRELGEGRQREWRGGGGGAVNIALIFLSGDPLSVRLPGTFGTAGRLKWELIHSAPHSL